MRLLQYPLSALLWLTGTLSFFIGASLVLIAAIILGPQRTNWLARVAARIVLKFVGIFVRSDGFEDIDRNRSYVFMSNHVNMFDIFILKGYIPNFFVAVEAHHHFSWPFYGALTRRLGNIPINRYNLPDAIESLKKAAAQFGGGKSLVILPEGTRTLDGKLREYKKGPFILAKEIGADVVVTGISGLYELKQKGKWLIRPGRIRYRCGRILSRAEFKDLGVPEFQAMVRKEMMELIGQTKDEHPAKVLGAASGQ